MPRPSMAFASHTPSFSFMLMLQSNQLSDAIEPSSCENVLPTNIFKFAFVFSHAFWALAFLFFVVRIRIECGRPLRSEATAELLSKQNENMRMLAGLTLLSMFHSRQANASQTARRKREQHTLRRSVNVLLVFYTYFHRSRNRVGIFQFACLSLRLSD